MITVLVKDGTHRNNVEKLECLLNTKYGSSLNLLNLELIVIDEDIDNNSFTINGFQKDPKVNFPAGKIFTFHEYLRLLEYETSYRWTILDMLKKKGMNHSVSKGGETRSGEELTVVKFKHEEKEIEFQVSSYYYNLALSRSNKQIKQSDIWEG